jgi:Glycosyl transferase family 11
MIIVRLMGGLGNQMFQYAFGRALAERHDRVLKIDISVLMDRRKKNDHFVFREYSLDIFDINEDFANAHEVDEFTKRIKNEFLDKLMNRSLGYKSSYIREPHYHFSEEAINSPNNVLVEGYWQSEKYFYSIRQKLKKSFTFKQPPGINCQTWLDEIDNSNSVCVHVRRGDFLINSNHGFCGLPYYQQAQKIMREKINNPSYFVFSDEIEWCRENMQFLSGAKFIPKDFAGYKDQDHLRMMAHCKNFIIPNSSFAWWAAWLGKKENSIVIAPNHWYKGVPVISDVYQSDWIVI